MSLDGRWGEHLALAERVLGQSFHDRSLLLQALVHRSYVLEHEREGGPDTGMVSNERLEFLGDAVLGALVAAYAYRAYPQEDEGRLTEVRSALVRRSTLAVVGEEMGLGALLLLDRTERRRAGKGHSTVLAEAFEAILAAIFLDQGLECAQDFLQRHLLSRAADLLLRAASSNAKSHLQELAQARLQILPSYTVVSRTGAPHDSEFEVEVRAGAHTARGIGSSIRAAEQHAAQGLLARLQQADPEVLAADDDSLRQESQP
jgi:ribonuclease-3